MCSIIPLLNISTLVIRLSLWPVHQDARSELRAFGCSLQSGGPPGHPTFSQAGVLGTTALLQVILQLPEDTRLWLTHRQLVILSVRITKSERKKFSENGLRELGRA